VRLDLSQSPARALFSPEQWRKIEANPTGRVEDAQWALFTAEQQGAIKSLRRSLSADRSATPGRTEDAGQLWGDGDAHRAGRTLTVHEIQGPGARSPYEGQRVTTQGIVTAVDDKGFYLQEPEQGIEQGSPAIFVFTVRRPDLKPGDEVSVSGEVQEFARPADRDDFPGATTTQLQTEPSGVRVKSRGNPLPELLIGKGGIELSHTASNQALWERMEGARVRINDPVVVGPPNSIPRFADLAVVPDGGEGAGKRTHQGGLLRDAAGNPHVIGVRMPLEGLPAVNMGTRFPKGLVGNVVERHGHHQVTVWDVGGPANLVVSPVQPEVSLLRERFPDAEHVLFIGSLNGENKDIKVEDINKVKDHDVRNVDDDVGDGKLQRMAEQIVKNLTSPDIVALQEIQDNDGNELSDVTDASETWQAIIDAVVAQGGKKYSWVDRPPVNNAEGGAPGGNIRTGFLYDPARVTLKEGSVHRLSDPAFSGSRLPLVATFEFRHGGQLEELTLQSVHNTSKRGRTAEEALARQVGQAEAINRWAKANAPKTDHQHLGVFGDRNAYTDEPPIQAELKDGALELLSLQLPEEKRYSAQFAGSSGELDHASVKTCVPVTIDLVHMNSDFDERFRASDHDGTLTAWDFRRSTK
jgi:predicted extracellular nuclease